jgi:hypothetical protein
VTDPDQPRTDPVVDRVNELTTTFMDIAGVLLLSAAAAYGARVIWGSGWALLVAGVSLLACSVLAQLRSRPSRPRSNRSPAVPEVPGPSHPGTVHIAGGR